MKLLSLGQENRRSGEIAASQRFERFVRLLEREGLRLGAHRDLWREREEFFAIAPGQICDGTNSAFLPQNLVGKRGDIAHVDAAAHHDPAASKHAQRRRNEGTDWSENDRRIQLFRRRFIRSAGPLRAETTREVLRRRVTGPGESENLALLVPGNLRNDVRGRAKSVNSEPVSVARPAQSAIADQSGA